MDIQTLWTVGTFFCGIIVTIAIWIGKSILAGSKAARDETNQRIEALAKSHNELDIKVARDYISVETFRLFEARILEAINALSGKFEGFLNQRRADDRANDRANDRADAERARGRKG